MTGVINFGTPKHGLLHSGFLSEPKLFTHVRGWTPSKDRLELQYLELNPDLYRGLYYCQSENHHSLLTPDFLCTIPAGYFYPWQTDYC